VPDKLRKFNGFLRYSEGTPENGLAITALAYTNSWHSTDQIRCAPFPTATSTVRRGRPDRRRRHATLLARHALEPGRRAHRVEDRGLRDLFDAQSVQQLHLFPRRSRQRRPVPAKRQAQDLGLNASHLLRHELAGFQSETTVGTQIRYDDIGVGLFNTFQRTSLSTVRYDQVSESSIGLYAKNMTRWTDWMRVTVGVRADLFMASVASDTAANSGYSSAFLASPKAGVVFGPFDKTEFYINAGLGYHSNDARGATIAVDPVDKTTPLTAVPLLVRSTGAEIGVRTQALRGLDRRSRCSSSISTRSSCSWAMPGRRSPAGRAGASAWNGPTTTGRAVGDVRSRHRLHPARFTDYSIGGDQIPGAPASSLRPASRSAATPAGSRAAPAQPWFTAADFRRQRLFLADHDHQRRVGYVFDSGIKLNLDAFNILNNQASQIDYYYTSRLPGEPAEGVADRHFHPIEPLAFRLTLAKAF